MSDFRISPAASLRVTLPPFKGNKRKKKRKNFLPDHCPQASPPPFIMKPHSNMRYFIRNLGPVDTYPNIYENGDFFLHFSILSTREQGFQAPETQVFENGPQSGTFFWIAGLSFVWTDVDYE